MSIETKPEHKPTKWVLANPGVQGKNYVTGPTGQLMTLTNETLKNPNVIKTLEHIESKTGARLFGTIVIKG